MRLIFGLVEVMKTRTLSAVWCCCALTLIVASPVLAKPRRAPPDVVVTEADDGKEVTLHGDQKLVVRLSEPGGPYIWWALWSQYSNVNLAKQQPKLVIKPPPSASPSHPMVGGSADRSFVFVPTKSTENFGIPLALIYSTPQFDLKGPGIKIFKVRVTTKKK
jgi:hypothetical protein